MPAILPRQSKAQLPLVLFPQYSRQDSRQCMRQCSLEPLSLLSLRLSRQVSRRCTARFSRQTVLQLSRRCSMRVCPRLLQRLSLQSSLHHTPQPIAANCVMPGCVTTLRAWKPASPERLGHVIAATLNHPRFPSSASFPEDNSLNQTLRVQRHVNRREQTCGLLHPFVSRLSRLAGSMSEQLHSLDISNRQT